MSDRPRLVSMPNRRERAILDWLHEAEAADASGALDRAFEVLPRVQQQRWWPWNVLADRLRPEPLGSPVARTIALLAAAALLLAVIVGTWLTVGQQAVVPTPEVVPPPPGLDTPEVPTAAPSAGALPLSSPAYEVIYGDGEDVFIGRTDGSPSREVAPELTGRLIAPRWGPDAGTALTLEQTTSSEQLWVLDLTGVRRPLVMIPCVSPCQSRNEAAWSHDGASIVFFQAFGEPVNGTPETCGLARYLVATQAVEVITSTPCAVVEERHPRFSPDDTRIAFWRSRSPRGERSAEIEDSALFIRDLATGSETQVTDWGIHASEFDWSPDGEWLAFVPETWDPTAADADMWRIRTDGTGLERMTSLDTASIRISVPRYTPDGRWLLFVRVTPGSPLTFGELLAIPAEGGEPVSVLPERNVLDFDVRAPQE
jgi:Tol biopolymer transport system component